MARKKFTELPAADTLSGTEIIAIVQEGESRRTTVSAVATGGAVSFLEWDFATSGVSPGDYPTDETKIYITTDESVYPLGTWFAKNSAGGWWTK